MARNCRLGWQSAKTRSLTTATWLSLEVDPHLLKTWDDYIPDNTIASLWEILSQKTQWHRIQVPDPQKLKCCLFCCFDLLWFRVICYTEKRTNPGAIHRLFELWLKAWLSLHQGYWKEPDMVCPQFLENMGTCGLSLFRNSLGFTDLKM